MPDVQNLSRPEAAGLQAGTGREARNGNQVAEAVRARIDWKHLLALELIDPGFGRDLKN
ncbi:hypothetical protein [Methylobacterium nodulans]|uniref:hypothetical protein n=1 Tax=Methylobacterium nodulans TaxID=114616 RepID=UPI0002E947FB|nr:hypothetical protein [Methylobacterium nodulans]